MLKTILFSATLHRNKITTKIPVSINNRSVIKSRTYSNSFAVFLTKKRFRRKCDDVTVRFEC